MIASTVRCSHRPLSTKEKQRGASPCVEVQDGVVLAHDPDDKMGGIDYLRLDKSKDKQYKFDADSNGAVFGLTSQEMLPHVFAGSNACCFAYGSTGSGKTYTMTGSKEMPGVIPLTVDDLFRMAGADCSFEMQYFEIYNETIKDLLQPSLTNLHVREDPREGTFVAGASKVTVRSRADVEAL